MISARPSGIVCPIATPLTYDETLDVAALRQLIDRLVPDLDGLLVLGSTGEFALLRNEVAQQAVEIAVEQVDGRIPVYAGVGDTGTARALERTQHAAAAGVDFALLTSPYYYGIQEQEVLARHFLTIADASPIPILIYNIPQNTYVHVTPALAERLSAHPNIVGMKDSWGDMIQFQKFLALKGDRFSVFQGREELAAACLWLGADGVVSAMNNFVPGMFQQLVQAVQAEDHELALDLQQRITNLSAVFQQGYWISALKALLQLMGIGNGRVASPLPLCNEEQRANIEQLLMAASLV